MSVPSNYFTSPQGIQKTFGTLSQLAKSSDNGAISQYSNSLGGVGNAAGIAGGIQQGGVGGYGSAALNTGKLAGRAGLLGNSNSSLNKGVGDAANVLGIYNGIKQGGVGGYGGAAVNAAQLGSKAGAFGGASGAIGSAAGYAAIPLALYNEINNWESGNTGSDAMAGAATGAAIGSVVPVVGTALGALIGGAGGALSSAFGNGRVDPENAQFNGVFDAYNKMGKEGAAQGATPDQIKGAQGNLMSQVQNPYLPLAGYFDLRNNQVKGNNPMYAQYGRKGEQKFTNDMVSQINDAAKAGTINSSDTPGSIYSKVVQPWEDSWGKGQSTDSNKDAMQGVIQQMIGQYRAGTAGSDWKAQGGDSPFANVGKLSLQNSYSQSDMDSMAAEHDAARAAQGLPPAAQQVAANPAPAVQPQMQPQPIGVTDMNRPVTRKRGGAISQASRKKFDDGGDVGGGNDFSSQPSFDPGSTIDFNSLYGGGTGNDTTDTSNYLGGNFDQQFANDRMVNDQLGSWIDSYAGANDTPAKGGVLSSLAKNATGGGGLSGLLKTYAPLIPLIQGAVQSSQNKKPTLPAGMSNSVGPMPTPQFNRQAVAAPTNAPGGAPMTKQDWYTYGSRPEAQFFTNNQVPLVGKAKGGSTPPPLRSSGALGQATGVPEFNSAAQSHVPDEGPGDGTSDDVDAKLSKGEYVMDANTVSMAGNGSNSAGAKALDKLRENLRKHGAQSNSKGKQFMKAKPLHKYLPKDHPVRGAK